MTLIKAPMSCIISYATEPIVSLATLDQFLGYLVIAYIALLHIVI